MFGDDCPLADLIAQARQDPEALGRLVERYRGYLLNRAEQALGFSPTPDLSVSDLVQDTFLDACRGFVNFRGATEGELLNWFNETLRNNVCDWRRRKRINQQRLPDNSSGGDPPAEDTSPSRRAMRGEQETRLGQALSQLPERQRLAVTLRHLEGRRLEEVAAALGCTNSAAAGLVKRGVEALHQRLGKESSI